MLVKLKGVHKVKRRLADGSVKEHIYAWRGGPPVKARPGTDAFWQEIADLRRQAETIRPLLLSDLITHFTTGEDGRPNPDFVSLAQTTRDDYEQAFKVIKAKWPRMPAKLTQQRGFKADIRKWHRSFAANPRKADKLLYSLSKVFSYAIKDELIEKNPCAGIDRLYTGSRRDSTWTADLIARFRAMAKPHVLLAFEMAILTGQRQGDLLSLTWKDYDGQHIMLRQSKTGKRVKVRVHASLKARLDKMPHDTLRILLNSRGRPWTRDGFKTTWGKECARLSIEGVTFHDLRGTFITEARRNGSTTEQIASVSGHSISEVNSVLEKHYLADDQQTSDAVILRMERNS